MSALGSPLGCQLIHFRDCYQTHFKVDTEDAQKGCAALVGVQQLTWQAWEASQGQMPAGLWIKFRTLIRSLLVKTG